ncbi:MAG: lysostaphin resistance A-like protein [Candidatus Ranarchaeia archaeon]
MRAQGTIQGATSDTDPHVSRAVAYIGIYVTASAFGVNGWNAHFISGNITLVVLETTIASAVLFLIALEAIPNIEKLHPKDYGVGICQEEVSPVERKKYTNPWTNKVDIPGHVSFSTTLFTALVLAIPVALIFQVPLYILQTGFFPIGFGITRIELVIPNMLLGLSSAVIEEVLYRGLLLSSLMILNPEKGLKGEHFNNLLQALLFTSLHPIYLSGLALNQAPRIDALVLYLAQAFLVSFFLGLLKNQTKSLIPGFIIHSAINVVGTLMI